MRKIIITMWYWVTKDINVYGKILEKRKAFEAKRKRHYQEWQVVQMARKQLLEQDEDEDEESNEENEEHEEDIEKDDNNSLHPEEHDFDLKFKCMPSCNITKGKWYGDGH